MKFGRFLLTILYPLFRLLYPFRVIGRENIPPEGEGRMLLCCNHISLIDPAYLLFGQKRPIYFMAKKEVLGNRFTRWLLGRQFGVFAVDRGAGDMAAIEHAVSLVESGKLMGIFPEGTRSKTGELGPIKSGAAWILSRTGADLLPVCLLTRHQKVRPFRRMTVVIGKPIAAAELMPEGEKPNLRAISRRIRDELLQLTEAYA